jgi:hypothetical protein
MAESVGSPTPTGVASVITEEHDLAAQPLVEPTVGRRGIGLYGRHALILLSVLAPFLSFVLVSGGTWLLDYHQWYDNWSYLKYFYDWNSTDPVLRDFLDHDYKGSRVAWIAIGYLVYHLLEPIAANLTLNATVTVLTLLVTFGLTARLFGSVAGAATIIASAFPVFYASGRPHAWSYQGGICNLFFLILLWSLTEHAWGNAPRRTGFVAGVMAALTLFTATNYIVAIPWVLAYWLLLRGRPGVREVVELGIVGAVGVVIVYATLSSLSVLAGGTPHFMEALMIRSARIASEGSFGDSPVIWLPSASWLVYPAIVSIGGLVTTVLLARRAMLHLPETRPFVAAFVGFAGFWGTMIVLEATLQAYIQYEHYNFMVSGPASVALGGILRWLPRGTREADRPLPIFVYPLLALMVVLPQILISPSTVAGVADPVQQALSAWYLPGTGVTGLIAGIVGMAFVASGAWRTLLPAGLCFGVACALTNPAPSPFHVPAGCGLERDNYILVSDVTRWMGDNSWHVSTRSWFPRSDVIPGAEGCAPIDLVPTYLAIEQAGMLWKITLTPPAQIADLDVREVRNIGEKPRTNLVIFSQPALARQFDRDLDAWSKASGVNPVPRRIRERTFTQGPLILTVQVYRLRGNSTADAPDAQPSPAGLAEIPPGG